MAGRRSVEVFDAARAVLVGGVDSPVRSFRAVGGDPLVFRKGLGAKVWDEDGCVYTDYCLSWGAAILGHAQRQVILAVKKTAERGIGFGTTTRAEADLACEIVRRVPSIERIRFVNSGTEATMSALRLARGATGRPLVVKFDGCYHGHADELLIAAGSGVSGLPRSSSAGVPPGHLAETIGLPYNDTASLERAFAEHGPRIAAVIVEPVAGNMGVVVPDRAFLKALRELTRRHGAFLIFDEVMTGFRTHPACVQGELGIFPDLTCLGKIIGGGFPIGAYGGRREIMEALAPMGEVYQAGTFSGTPVVMRAGLATLRRLTPEFYRALNRRAASFAEAVQGWLTRERIPARLEAYGSMFSLRFRPEPVRDAGDAAAAADPDLYARLFQRLLKRGIYLPPAEQETFFLSGAHSKRDLQDLCDALQAFFKEVFPDPSLRGGRGPETKGEPIKGG